MHGEGNTMYTLSVLIGGLLLAPGVLIVIRLWLVIAASLAAVRVCRNALARQLQRLRLARMLRVPGMDIDAYLARQHINRLHRPMQNCAECDYSVVFDEYLLSGTRPDSVLPRTSGV